MTVYQVKTPVFEGPLPLLLELVEKRKLPINQLSLSEVTDEFLNYIKELEGLNLGDVSEFVLVAATLILIKSKSLLPQMELTPEEESSIKDLEERLRRLEIIKSIMPAVKNQFGKKVIFDRRSAPFIPVFAPDKTITLENLTEAAWSVINALPKKEFIPEARVANVVSIEEMMKNLIVRIEEGLRLSFKNLSSGKEFKDKREEKFHVVVSFLAMLELVHQGIISVHQESNFNDIAIEKVAVEQI